MANQYPGNHRTKELIDELDALTMRLRGLQTFDETGPGIRKRLIEQCGTLVDELLTLQIRADEIKHPDEILNPADPRVIGKLVAAHLLRRPFVRLEAIPTFYGSGVYALYYSGNAPAYQPIVKNQTPIYIGRSEPATAEATTSVEQGTRLHRRLQDHVRSIRGVQNLSIGDFRCRFSVVVTAWEAVAESYLIRQFKPVWNKEIGVLQGFGKHGDEPTTRQNLRSSWDTIHPGRKATRSSSPSPTQSEVDEIWSRVANHFKHNDPSQMPTSETILNDL